MKDTLDEIATELECQTHKPRDVSHKSKRVDLKEDAILKSDPIKLQIRNDVIILKNILKDDMSFAKDIIDGLCSLEKRGGYSFDTFYFKALQKYPVDYNLACVVSDMAKLVAGEHEIVRNELEENFSLEKDGLCHAIILEVVGVFDMDTT